MSVDKQTWQSFLDRLDRKFVGAIYKALRLQYRAFGEDVKRYGADFAKSRISLNYLNRDITPVIIDIHKDAGLYMAKFTIRELKKQEGQKRGLGFNEQWVKDIQEYFRLYLLNKSVLPISETTRARLLEIMQQSVEEGWGVDRTVQEINNLKEIRNRARTIVRTETVRAANFGTFLGQDQYDFEVQKEWINIEDNRTRRTHTHAGVGGDIKEPYERFSNGLMFPGDPEGSAKEVINCRCTLAWVPKRDSNGRLIPKKRTTTQGQPIPRMSAANLLNAIAAGISLGNLISSE